MELNCKNCGAMCGHWLVVETGGREAGAPPRYKCVCLKCQSVWQMEHHPLQAEKRTMHNATACAVATGAEMVETFGVKPPPDDYYLHQGHAWALLEEDGQVRVGLDDFSQKILGPADEVRLPAVGAAYYQDHLCLALVKDGKKAAFEAPVDGVVTEVNAKVVQKPRLVHDDPYGAGWLFKVKPTNLQHNLDNLSSGRQNAAWLGKESHRLLHLVETAVGATLPDGGGLVDDVFSHFPGLGWRRLVKEFFLTNVTRHWKKRV